MAETVASSSTLRRIRALLERAEHPGTPEGEREAASRRAMALMTEYSITEAMLDASGEKSDTIVAQNLDYTGEYRDMQRELFDYLAQALGMRTAYWSRSGHPYRSRVVGFSSDVELMMMLFPSLLIQRRHALTAEAMPSWLARSEVVTWKRSFMHGFNVRVLQRLRESRKATVVEMGEGSGAELVLATRERRVEAEYERLHPGIKAARRRARIVDETALERGVAAGSRADLLGPKLGGQRKQIGGR